MNAQHPIPNPRVLLGVFMLLCAALVVGCQDIETPVGPELDTSAVSETAGVSAGAKPDCNLDPTHPSCGGDDGGDGNAFTVAMMGGLVTTSDPPQILDSFKENKRQISGEMDVFTVGLSLTVSRDEALADPTTCSLSCDDAAVAPAGLDCGQVFDILANAFVSVEQPHPTVATSGYAGLNIGFNKNAVNGPPLSNCPFTGIAAFEPPSGGGVLIRNCQVTGDPDARVFTVDTDPANTVEAGQRFETDGDESELGPQDYRASLNCPLKDAFTVTFAPK